MMRIQNSKNGFLNTPSDLLLYLMKNIFAIAVCQIEFVKPELVSCLEGGIQALFIFMLCWF